jgi:Uma2 family endonuclease
VLRSHVVLDPRTIAPERIRPLKRTEYERMVELGLFEDERVELLAGQLIEMSPQGEPHAFVVAELGAQLTVALVGRARVRQHSPLALSDDSVPEPDIAVVPLDSDGSRRPDWAHLVVEVSDSSLRKDRDAKGPLYAAAGIPEYWIVNLVDGVLEVYTDPTPSGYQARETYGRDAEVAPRAFPDVMVRVGEILPASSQRLD